MVWTVAGTALLAVAAAAYGAANGQGDAGGGDAKPEALSAGAATPSASPTPAPEDLAPALDGITANLAGRRLSVALMDTASGEWAAYGDGAFDTASIVKVDILATLLLQAQDAGRVLTTKEQAYAADMIQNSDNDATSALWTVIGSATGLDAANKRLGLIETQGGDGTVWGVTQTTAEDQVRLLRSVFGADSPLSEPSRAYIQGLMHHIAPGQDWGISVVADDPSATALKNGWLERTLTKKWDVNSIGQVEIDGRTYFMAVLTNGHTTQEAGISFVEEASRAAVREIAALR
ncbi:serine hydrolase [Streptomyces liangshanensis]|uniref:serine hydrolase n=1 Tax=Streptomyces liangshanensis TaxID=2717324 RepID=UPI001FBB0E4B|nr:serine hydrolase [Streptomyces liangshanensis]